MVRLMAKELIHMQTAQNTLVAGLPTAKKVMESRHGLKEASTWGTTRITRNMGKASWYMEMAAHIMVRSRITKCQGMESTLGLTIGPMKVHGSKIKCMAKVFSNGKMVDVTKAISLTTSAKDAEFLPVRTVKSTTENGKMVSSMAREQ